MDAEIKRASKAGLLVNLAALVIVIAGLRAADQILIPFLLSAFLAIIIAPWLFWLQRRGLTTGMALFIVIFTVIVAATMVVVLIGTSLDDFAQALPAYQARLLHQTEAFIGWFKGFGIEISEQTALKYVNPGAAMELASNLLSGLGGVLSNGFLIFLTVTFILLEASGLPAKLHAVFDDPSLSFVHLGRFNTNIKRYMVIKTATSLVTGIVITTYLSIIGVDFALLWGLLAFLLNYVPNIGSIIAAVPAVLLALVELGTGAALLTVLGYVIVNILIGSVWEPRWMGQGLGLSTLVVFLSLIFWGWVFGPVGMFLSVPLTMTMKIALDSNEDTRWLAELLSPSPPPAKEESPSTPSR